MVVCARAARCACGNPRRPCVSSPETRRSYRDRRRSVDVGRRRRRSFHGAWTTYGGLDILVNNVGLARGATIVDTSDIEWQEAFDQTLFPAVRASRLAVPHMRRRGGGSIIMIASIWGRESGGRMTYNAVKAAEISLAKSMAQQLARRQHPREQCRAGVDCLSRRLLAQASAGGPRRHRRIRGARAAVRPLRSRRGSRARSSLSSRRPARVGSAARASPSTAASHGRSI